jgi:hypothetical protein
MWVLDRYARHWLGWFVVCSVAALRYLGFAKILLSLLVAAPAVAVRLSSVGTRFAFVVLVACIEAFALWLPVHHLNSLRACWPSWQPGSR